MRKAQGRFVAEWDRPGIAGWAVRQAAKSVWRTFPLYDFDELLAEAKYCFALCRDKYEKTVENEAHFAALFRRVFTNQITDLANERRKRQLTGFSASELHSDENLMDYFKGHYSAAETADILLDLEGAPFPVISMLREILEGVPAEKPVGVPYGRTASGQYAPGHALAQARKACNDWLCETLNITPGTDLVGAIMARWKTAAV